MEPSVGLILGGGRSDVERRAADIAQVICCFSAPGMFRAR